MTVVKVETPEELMSDVITLGSYASPIVPVVIFAASDRLFAVVAVPVTSPVRLPTKVFEVVTPEIRTLPVDSIATPDDVAGLNPICKEYSGFVVPIPIDLKYVSYSLCYFVVEIANIPDNNEASPINLVAVITCHLNLY